MGHLYYNQVTHLEVPVSLFGLYSLERAGKLTEYGYREIDRVFEKRLQRFAHQAILCYTEVGCMGARCSCTPNGVLKGVVLWLRKQKVKG